MTTLLWFVLPKKSRTVTWSVFSRLRRAVEDRPTGSRSGRRHAGAVHEERVPDLAADVVDRRRPGDGDAHRPVAGQR